MYKYSHRIGNPDAYEFLVLADSTIIIRDKGGLRRINEEKHFCPSPNPLTIFEFNYKLYVIDWENNFQIFNAATLEVLESGKNKFFFPVRHSPEVLGMQVIDNDKLITGILNRNGTVIDQWEINTHGIVSLWTGDTILFLETLEKMFAMRPGMEKPIWQFNFNGLGSPMKFRQFAGSYNGKVVMTMDNGGIVILDGNTGKLKQYWPDTRLQYWLTPSETGSPVFYGLNHSRFIEVDAAKETLVRNIDIEAQLRAATKVSSFVIASRIHEGQIFFVTHTGYAGMMDPSTATFTWTHALELNGNALPGSIETIQVQGDKLYVRDTGGNLHVFGRQDAV